MRKIILAMQVSLDGFFEGVDRDISWHTVDEELHGHFKEKLAAMGGQTKAPGQFLSVS